MKKIKKDIAVLLAALMLLSAFSITVFASKNKDVHVVTATPDEAVTSEPFTDWFDETTAPGLTTEATEPATEATEPTTAPTEATEPTEAPEPTTTPTEANTPTQAHAHKGKNADIADVVKGNNAAKTIYFYMPQKWRNTYNDTYDGYDLDSCSAGIYWWETSFSPKAVYGDTRDDWPGYNITETVEGHNNIFVARLPADIKTIIFNNTVKAPVTADKDLNEENRMRYAAALQTANITAEYYVPGEDGYGFYPDGTETVDNMIYVCNLKDTEVNKYTGKETYKGAWFYYYGEGKYGIYKTLEEAEYNNAVFENGEWPGGTEVIEPTTDYPENTDSTYPAETATGPASAGNTIYFNATGWNNYSRIYCHIWEIGVDSFFPWQSKKEICRNLGNNLFSYDLSMLDYSTSVTGGLQSTKDYCIIFSANTGVQTYDMTFGKACVGDTATLTGNKIENPVDSEKQAFEAVWAKSTTHGPHLTLTSIGNIIGSNLCPNEKGEEVIGDWVPTYYKSFLVNATDALAKAYPIFGISSLEQIENIFAYIKSKNTGEDEEYIYKILKDAFDKAYPAGEQPTGVPTSDTVSFLYLPSKDQIGCTFKVIIQTKDGKFYTYEMTEAPMVYDGTRVYEANVPANLDIEAVQYQIYKGETWNGAVTLDPGTNGKVITSEGKIYNGQSSTVTPGNQKPGAKPSNTVTASKKANTLKVSVKTKTVKLKKLKKKAQTINPITIKNAKGSVKIKLTDIPKKLKGKVSVTKKGEIKLKRWKKAKKGNYPLEVTVTAKGNKTYSKKTITKKFKIKIQ